MKEAIFTVFLFLIPIGYIFSQSSEELYISEFMAANDTTLNDEDGNASDWLELHNPASQPVHLKGWYISDDQDQLTKWEFPDRQIEADGYLIVFASGKDRKASELHTNFKLAASGEKLFLTQPDGETIAFSIGKKYPQQYTDISYSLIDGEWTYSQVATPGTRNHSDGLLPLPEFSFKRGFYEQAFSLEITTEVENSLVLYTNDGSVPDETNGMVYTDPIIIDSTSIIRAIVVKENYPPGRVITHSYIFPASVIRQTNNPEGYPDNWGKFSTIEGNAPADYEMDQEITQSREYKKLIIPALSSLPSISIVGDKDHFFSFSTHPDSGGIYIYTNPPEGKGKGMGEGWERSVSAEYILPDGGEGFQIDAGIRIHGGHSRLPEKSPKHSFRLAFRGEYGYNKLNYDLFGEGATTSFKNLVLRAGFNRTWIHWTNYQGVNAQYINDSWVKDTYRKMGHVSAHHQFVHLYLNGMYWGVYNISERMDSDFMEAYLGGEGNSYDIIKDYAELISGEKDAWNEMMQMAEDPTRFMEIQGKDEAGMDVPFLPNYLDFSNLVDYMILNFYIGNRDWDHHNWAAARNRNNPGKGFQFFPWDSENSFISLSHNEVSENNSGRPSYLYQQFRRDLRFRTLFAQRVNELLGPGGLLSPDSVAKSWLALSSDIELAMVAESARWGDYRRDVHPYNGDDFELFTPFDHWKKAQEQLLTKYFPARSDIVYNQLMDIDLAKDPAKSLGDFGGFPNPFEQFVAIYYQLRTNEKVKISIYDLQGRLIENIFEGELNPGLHQVYWVPEGEKGGVYLYQIKAGSEVFSGKLLFNRK